MRIDGARALVIGGGGEGIGRGITRAYAAAGASVAVADLEPERADVAAVEIAAGGGRACAISGGVLAENPGPYAPQKAPEGRAGLDGLGAGQSPVL
jgi:3-oxoacyl-[acyl-carrier protein] reductase